MVSSFRLSPITSIEQKTTIRNVFLEKSIENPKDPGCFNGKNKSGRTNDGPEKLKLSTL